MANLHDERINLEKVMNCGKRAKVIEYYTVKNIVIRFEDGAERTCTWDAFNKGTAVHPSDLRCKPSKTKGVSGKVGDHKMMNCGIEAKVIAIRGSGDIDVQFSDGTVVKHRRYSEFKSGKIRIPCSARVGDKRVMNCGLKAELIAFHAYTDVDIRFENGETLIGANYGSFESCTLRPSSLRVFEGSKKDLAKNRLNDERMMKCGETAKVIAYRGCHDIDVKFASGLVRTKQSYSDFLRGTITNIDPASHRCVIKYGVYHDEMVNGLLYKILRKNDDGSLDIEFEDGTVLKNKDYSRCVHMKDIGHPYLRAQNLELAYTLNDIRYYYYQTKGHRYLGTAKEIVDGLRNDGLIKE